MNPDIGCVAAPVIGVDSRAFAAVSVSGTRSRMEKQRLKLITEVVRTGQELSALIQRLGSAFERI